MSRRRPRSCAACKQDGGRAGAPASRPRGWATPSSSTPGACPPSRTPLPPFLPSVRCAASQGDMKLAVPSPASRAVQMAVEESTHLKEPAVEGRRRCCHHGRSRALERWCAAPSLCALPFLPPNPPFPLPPVNTPCPCRRQAWPGDALPRAALKTQRACLNLNAPGWPASPACLPARFPAERLCGELPPPCLPCQTTHSMPTPPRACTLQQNGTKDSRGARRGVAATRGHEGRASRSIGGARGRHA